MKSIQHYFDWNSPKDITLCGLKLNHKCFIQWVTNWKYVTCKKCLKIHSKS